MEGFNQEFLTTLETQMKREFVGGLNQELLYILGTYLRFVLHFSIQTFMREEGNLFHPCDQIKYI
jgi:hypothetical protein